MKFIKLYITLILVLLFSISTSAQSSKRRVLERKRVQIQKDIAYFNTLLNNTKRKEQNLINDVKDLNTKILKRDELIKAITDESNALAHEISVNRSQIKELNSELKELKEDYAEMIYKSYKSKSQNSRLMFVLSSSNFVQAYKRIQYMKQYTDFRKKQGDIIQQKTIELQNLNDGLIVKKNQKLVLVKEKKKEQGIIELEKNQQEEKLSEIKKKEDKYISQIKNSQKEEKRIDNQLKRLIRNAIAKSNKASGNTSKTRGFTLTPELKKLASKFENNKGKLPWPLTKGYVTMRYGKQPHPVVKTTTINSNGVRIEAEKGSKARAVFDGEVLAIQVSENGLKTVMVQHGIYFSVYRNLSSVAVQKGDKITTKQEIGTIFTDKISGKTTLYFVMFKEENTENPSSWIYNM